MLAGSVAEDLMKPPDLDPAQVLDQAGDGGRRGDQMLASVPVAQPVHLRHDDRAVLVEEGLEAFALRGGGCPFNA